MHEMKKIKEILNKQYDLPPLRVWHYLVFFILIFTFGYCMSADAKLPEKVYKWIEKAECGPFKPPCCHEDKKDSGGFTCIGIAIRSNADIMSKIITNSYQKCSSQAVPTLKGPQKYRVGCKSHHPAKKEIKSVYYERYYKKFEKCPFKVALQLTDSQILSGQGVRLFQRSHGLVEDGIWGPKSQKACSCCPDMKAFNAERKKRFLKLKNCKYHCKGWFKRLDNLEKYINKLK